jgi:nitroimidazol reductase NimA-like FMN-containing flavoprotein (pyridoxamine 5'-phosphate oxidase superfamily)
MTLPVQFFDLDEGECRALLGRQRIGRLAFLSGVRLEIQPVGYVLHDDWLFMRSAYGTKLAAIDRHPYVALEADEIRGPFDGASVVVRGTIYELSGAADAVGRATFATALRALRTVMPETLGPDDPVPDRTIVYGLRIDAMTGRRAGRAEAWRPPVTPLRRIRQRQSDGS